MRAASVWWRPRNLLLAWCGYWAVLLVITLGRAIVTVKHLVGDPNSHGSAGISFGDGRFVAHITQGGQSVWTGSVSVLTLAMLVAVPPLLLWLMWLVGTSRTNNAEQRVVNDPARRQELYATDSRTEIIESSTSKRRAREES
jgi:hypothetical protein